MIRLTAACEFSSCAERLCLFYKYTDSFQIHSLTSLSRRRKSFPSKRMTVRGPDMFLLLIIVISNKSARIRYAECSSAGQPRLRAANAAQLLYQVPEANASANWCE